MKPLLILLLTLTTTLAQRTPLKVNGTVLNNPNFTNSSTITFSPSGSDLTANLVSPVATGSTTGRALPVRFSERRNILDFGAIPDDGIDDTTAIHAAIAAMTSGQMLYIPAGTFNISNIIFAPPDNCGIECDGILESATTGVAVRLGSYTASRDSYYVRGLKVNRSPANRTGIGVECVNLYRSRSLDMARVFGFSTNCSFVGINGFGFTYNEVKFGLIWDGKTNVLLSALLGSSQGYCNDNNFFGGSISWQSSLNTTNSAGIVIEDSASQINGNRFYGVAVESVTGGGNATNAMAGIIHGWNNQFFYPRVEGPTGFWFTTNSLRNDYFAGYTSATGEPINNGVQNKIQSIHTMHYTGGPANNPVYVLRNNGDDAYPALGIAAADGLATNTFLYGNGGAQFAHNVKAAKVSSGSSPGTPLRALHTFGTATGLEGSLLMETAGSYRFNIYPYTVGNVAIAFDAADVGAGWISGDVGSNFAIHKAGDQLLFRNASGHAAGAGVTWNTGFYLNYNGAIGINGSVVYSPATANRAAYFDGSKVISASATTDTELGYLSGVTSAVQTQLNSKITKTSGSATLVGGTVTVSTASVTANSRIFLTVNTPGGSVGSPYVSARSAGVSFTITSTSGTDTSAVAWMLFEP